MEDEPNRKSENRNDQYAIPGPVQIMCLDREDHDHQVIGEAGVAEEGAVFRIFAAKTAEESESAKSEDQESDEEIYRQHRVEGEMRTVRTVRAEVRPQPLRTRPKEAEAGLECRAEVCFRRGEFVKEKREVQGNDAPDEGGVLEGSSNEFQEGVPIETHY